SRASIGTDFVGRRGRRPDVSVRIASGGGGFGYSDGVGQPIPRGREIPVSLALRSRFAAKAARVRRAATRGTFVLRRSRPPWSRCVSTARDGVRVRFHTS